FPALWRRRALAPLSQRGGGSTDGGRRPGGGLGDAPRGAGDRPNGRGRVESPHLAPAAGRVPAGQPPTGTTCRGNRGGRRGSLSLGHRNSPSTRGADARTARGNTASPPVATPGTPGGSTSAPQAPLLLVHRWV